MSSSLSRRALLASATSVALAAIASRAHAEEGAPAAPIAPPAAPANPRIVKISNDARGVTVTLDLAHAPFPAQGSWHQDSTVIAFIPHHHRVARDASVSVVVHFHGHHTTAERAITAHQLKEQLFESKQNAILLVPQLAVMAADSSAGKLESNGGLGRMVAEALRVLDTAAVRAATGPAALPSGATIGRLCVSAHSGGFHAAATSLKNGGVPVQEVYLFDALYADVDTFKDWVIAGKGKPMNARHKLVSYFTAGTTEANTGALFAQLEKNGVVCAYEQTEGSLSRADLTRAEAVSIRTRVGHGAVTSELNGLRDCLYASALHRNLRSSWFDAKNGARPLERRR